MPKVCVPTELHNQGTDDEGDDFARNFGLEHLSAAKQWDSEHSQSMKDLRRERGRPTTSSPVFAALRDAHFILQ